MTEPTPNADYERGLELPRRFARASMAELRACPRWRLFRRWRLKQQASYADGYRGWAVRSQRGNIVRRYHSVLAGRLAQTRGDNFLPTGPTRHQRRRRLEERQRRLLLIVVAVTTMTAVPAIGALTTTTVFADGFESGGLSNWTASVGAAVQGSVVYEGAFAARVTSTGSAAYVKKVLPSQSSDVIYQGRVDVMSQSQSANVSLVRFRGAGLTPIMSLFRRGNGRLQAYNEVTGATTMSATSLPAGGWHLISVRLTVNGVAGAYDISVDGVRVADLSATANTGTTPVGMIYIGDLAGGRPFDFVYDSQSVGFYDPSAGTATSSSTSLAPTTVSTTVPPAPTTTTAAPVTTTTAPAPTTTTPAPVTTTGLAFTDANWTIRYGSCGRVDSNGNLVINLTTACNPGNDGHYRTDWSNVGTYTAGKDSCTTIPVSFPGGAPQMSSGSWWQFAEAKIPSTAYADWGLYVHNKFDGGPGTEFDFRMAYVSGPTTNGTSHPSLWHGGDPTVANTFKVCSNYATDASGYVNLYVNGNVVFQASGVYILQGQTTDDLDLNDYTGGAPVSNTVVHGVPTVS